MRQYAAVGLLLLVCASPAPAQSGEVVLRASTGTAVAWDERYTPGVQQSLAAWALAQFLGRGAVGGGIGLGYDGALSSPVVDLVSYRGYGGLAAELFGAARVGLGRGPYSFDLRGGLRASISSYYPAPIYFLLPSVFLEPGLSYRSPKLPSVTAGISLPVVLSRRADLRLAASASVAVTVGVAFKTGGTGE